MLPGYPEVGAPDQPGFHPWVAEWFGERLGAPTRPQAEAWPRIQAGEDVLLAAPTGSGKTLAAFLSAIDGLYRRALVGPLPARTLVVYVSPLKALGNDVEKNLRRPLAELADRAEAKGAGRPSVTVAVRTGDTEAKVRAQLAKSPPHILVTTPESLYILLTSERGRAALGAVETVIVDEIHALVRDKRGSHLALSLERLDALIEAQGGRRPQRIALSATQRPLEKVAALVGGARPLPTIIDAGFLREMDLTLEVPSEALGSVASHEMMAELYDRVAKAAEEHRTTLVFVNTRRLVERVAHGLAQRLGEDQVAAHHGSMAKDRRLLAEQRLKAGELRCIVATSSLELGIDIGEVELVVQIGSPRNIAVLLQRVGRSGHTLGRVPKGRVWALTRDQLVEGLALLRALEKRNLDALQLVEEPIDVLAQQLVAMVAAEDWDATALYQVVKRAHPYRNLSRETFDQVLTMLSEGLVSSRGRQGAHVHWDRVHGVVRGRRHARLLALTSGGTIPEAAVYPVVLEPDEKVIGTVDEDWAIETSAGDVFLLGSSAWRIRRIEAGRVRVESAAGLAPTVPFWLGEAPGRTMELSREVAGIREELGGRLARETPAELAQSLSQAHGIGLGAAQQVVDYLAAAQNLLGALPTQERLIAERFFDESGAMHLVIHSPYGSRLNRAFGLALRKRFCRGFDFELQAAATDEGLLLSLGPVHSFPLLEVFSFLSPKTVAEVLTQAVLQTPIFGIRWRWVTQRALAVARWSGGKKVPPFLLRMKTDDLLAGVFPMAAACQDNIEGDIELPDHPLVNETMRDCLEEAMDLPGLTRLLEGLQSGRIQVIAKDTPEPSPLAHELVNASPYAYLDDAPLEERRTRAVQTRRGLPADLLKSLGALDPEAIVAVAADARSTARDAEELHDVLLSRVYLPMAEVEDPSWGPLFAELIAAGRAVAVAAGSGGYASVERTPWIRTLWPSAALSPEPPPLNFAVDGLDAEQIAQKVIGAALEHGGPATVFELAARYGLDESTVNGACFALEAKGAVLRGQYSPNAAAVEWVDKRILARIHRRTIGRLQKEIEPVTPAVFYRFLTHWQHLAPGTQLEGERAVERAVAQLQGIGASVAAWEEVVLPARVRGYQPNELDRLGLLGELAWARMGEAEGGDGAMVHRVTPVTLCERDALPWLLSEVPAPDALALGLTKIARDVHEQLLLRGASFVRDLSARTGYGARDVEAALRELIYVGLVTGDGFLGLRQLTRGEPASGRFSLLRQDFAPRRDVGRYAELLLKRYGVVFRELLAREPATPPWRELLMELRQKEAQGLVRGGRFVHGFVGEQYALPEAVERLRAQRSRGEDEVVKIGSADPLNLVGILTPGPRVSAGQRQTIVLRGGVPEAMATPAPEGVG